MLADVPPEVAISAVARATFYLVVLAATARLLPRHPIVAGVCALALASIVATLADQRPIASVIAVPFAALVAYLLVDRVKHDPKVMTDYLAAQQAQWSKDRHDLINDVQAEMARRIFAERRLMEFMDDQTPEP